MAGVEDILTEAEIFERLEKAEKEVETSINNILNESARFKILRVV